MPHIWRLSGFDTPPTTKFTVRLVQNVAMDCLVRASADGSQPWPPTADCWYGERAADVDDGVPKWCALSVRHQRAFGARPAPVSRTLRRLVRDQSVKQER